MAGPTPHPNRPSAAARYLFMALLGLVVGAVATVSIMRAIEARHDPYPGSVMYVMSAHMKALKQNVTQNRCTATDTLPHLQTLRLLANDIEPAFKDMREDSRFAKYASDLRAVVDNSLASPPLNCAGVQKVTADIDRTCDACHQYAHN
jgi:hypothetical protein